MKMTIELNQKEITDIVKSHLEKKFKVNKIELSISYSEGDGPHPASKYASVRAEVDDKPRRSEDSGFDK